MRVNCATQPTMTSFGRLNTTLKSLGFRVRPMPNITMPSRVFTQLVLTTLNGPGKNRAPAATTMTMAAMYLPTKSLTFSRVFMLFRPFCFTGCSCMKHPEWPGAAIKNAFVSHHKRQRRVHPLRYHSYLPAVGLAPQCASNNARLLVTEACRPALLGCARIRSARKLGEDLPTGFVHCLASTGSSLQHSARVLVLVIAEYFTAPQYTPLPAESQAKRACQCFI